MIGFSFAVVGATGQPFAHAQTATIPIRPSDTAIPPDVIYPDAVTCDVVSPEGIVYRMIFYKGLTISFANEPNNAAEYGTTVVRDPDEAAAAVDHKWRLQLGKPGNITLFALPAGWTTRNCPVGKSIAKLVADKQALRLFTRP